MALNAFLSNQGTQTSLLTDNTGGTAGTLIPVMKIDVSTQGTAGTIWGGAVTVSAGTVNAGTINAGTFRADGRTTQNIVSFGTQYGTSGSGAATIIGSTSVGSGTSLWVNDISIINPNGSILCVLGFGTAQQGTNVLFRGILGTQTAVGIEKSFSKAVNAGMTNQDLVFSLGGAGTVDLSFSYFISA